MSNIKEIEKSFIEQLDEWHRYFEPYDTELDIALHKSYYQVLKNGKKHIDWNSVRFSPSGATKDARELYSKLKKLKPDEVKLNPHQRRYMSQGTALGDWLQREILLCERHYEKFTGKKPRFTFARTKEGYPAFEDFVFSQKEVNFNGQSFNLIGTCDGIMVDNKTGEKVLLEVKSKQNTPSKTSLSAMKEPQESHVKQVACYGEMYDVEKALIVYINGAKVEWFADDEKIKRTPDIRVFGVDITDDLKEEVFEHFAIVTESFHKDKPLLPDLKEWLFNDYKQAISESLSDDDVKKLEESYGYLADLGMLKPYEERSVESALLDIKQRRASL